MIRGFDCNVKLSYDKARELRQAGFDFAMRYVGRLKQASFDIDKQELQDILRAGLAVGIVQHCPGKPGILPSKELGIEYGKNAALFSEQAGYKIGCIVYLDLEDVNADYKNRQTNIIAYCNAWHDEVKKAGYLPGIYIGFNTFLTGEQLYNKLKFTQYWKSFSNVPDVAVRGYSMFQKVQEVICGITLDTDEAMPDNKGDMPVFMCPEKVPVNQITVYSDGSVEVKGV